MVDIIFCLPGNQFSTNYFNSWNETIAELQRQGLSYSYSMGYDPVVYYTRNRILGGQNVAGKTQKPWQSSIDYSVMIWIDSDIVWRAADILNLINHPHPIVAGTYPMSNGQSYPIVENLDYNHLSETGAFEFLTRNDLEQRLAPFKVSYTGFGFIALKHGVVEALEYPWFRPRWVTTEVFHDFCAEDVGFCWSAAEAGLDIWIDPKIRVGHEKTVIL